jgi:hypothetical protein
MKAQTHERLQNGQSYIPGGDLGTFLFTFNTAVSSDARGKYGMNVNMAPTCV